jgi:hypothetical protein
MIWHLFLHYTGSDNVSGPWYGFWSGFGSDLGELVLLGACWTLIRKHNCHVNGCWRVVTQHDPEVHAPACARHHSHRHLRGIPRTKGEQR